MGLDAAPEVVEEIITEPEVVETPVEAEGAEVTEETLTEETTAEETTEETPEEEVAEIPIDTSEPITFDASDELPAILEKADKVLERYDLAESPELQSLIDTLKAKASTEPVLGEYEVFGTVDEVKSLLEEQSLLISQKMNDDGSGVRPKTDEFAERLHTRNPQTAALLRDDLLRLESTKYKGYNAAQEVVADAFARQGDTVNTVLDRFSKVVQYMREGIPAQDIPAFIPEELHSAYNSLPKETRDEIADLEDDSNYDQSGDRVRKLRELSLIKKGLDADAQESQLTAYKQHQESIAFNQDVQGTQEKFYSGIRDVFITEVSDKVKFSEDPKVQAMSAYQVVSLVTQAFDEGSMGEFAREGLQKAGVTFDHTKAQQLLNDVEMASVALVKAQRDKNPQTGEVLDQYALKKAVHDFEETGRKWQVFKKDTVDQLARVTASGTQEAVKAEVAKIKVVPKARAVAKGVGSQVQKGEVENPHPYRSPAYYDWYAERQLQEQARKTKAYTQVA